MVPLPKSDANTVRKIYKAYADRAEDWESMGIPIGEAGAECPRATWYAFRWASQPAFIPGRMRRRFETGKREEDRIIADLQLIGVSVKGRQEKVQALGGHVRGKIDGRIMNLPEAPKTEHLLEAKAVNLKTMRALHNHGVKKTKPEHYAQCQLAMHILGLSRAAYVVACTDDDGLYLERLEYDVFYASSLMATLSRIIQSERPPAGICKDANDHRGLFCKHKAPCFGGELMRETCRSCAHSAPVMDVNADWACTRFQRALSLDDQKQGCPAHLNIPETVPGEQVDCDPAAGTITYKIDGVTWVDGPAVDGD